MKELYEPQNEERLIYFSILMSVYKKTKSEYLDNALKSIFEQNYCYFELVLVVDGPITEEHEYVISKWVQKNKDKVTLLRMKSNKGLAFALNEGIICCKNGWIVRMDADDYMRFDRLQYLHEFIINNENIDVIGSWIEEFDEDMINSKGIRKVYINHEDIVKFGKWRNPMNHVTVCYKKSAVVKVGYYNKELRRSQDYALWANLMVNNFRFANIPESLVNVRRNNDFFENRNSLNVIKYDIKQRIFMLKIKYLNISEFCFSLILRILIRIMPLFIVKKIYFFLRANNS